MSGKTRYIMSNGELKRRENSLSFRKNGKLNHMPIQNIRELYLMNEISINTKLLDFLGRMGIIVHFFNYYGNYSGTFYPREKYLSGKLKITQGQKYLNQRLDVARPIVLGICENIRELLIYYKKHNSDEKIVETINYFKNDIHRLLDKTYDIKSLLAVEGSIWNEFYKIFRIIINDEFKFDKRVKRPPDNPINAMISFGNSILYAKTLTQIYHTHLDPCISFLHEPSSRRFSLALDISEVFKPVIVYKTILKLVNKKMIKVEEHFIRDYNHCILNESGKKIFISEIQSRLDTTFHHDKLKRKISYEYAIRQDLYKLIKFILEDKPFKPFSIKDKL